jgi:hypothetical protein
VNRSHLLSLENITLSFSVTLVSCVNDHVAVTPSLFTLQKHQLPSLGPMWGPRHMSV